MKPARSEWLYVPNLITLLRLVALPVPIWLIATGHDYWALLAVCVGIATDVLDGYLARRLNQISELGKILDPLSDKLSVASLVITLYLLRDFPLWAALIIIGRDLLILAGSLLSMKLRLRTPTSNLFGKLTALAWSLLIASYLTPFIEVQRVLLIIAPAMVPISFILYVRQVLRLRQRS